MGSEASGDPAGLLPARLLVAWVALLAGLLTIAIGLGVQAPDHPTPFAVAHAYRLLVGGELFFLLVLVRLLTGVARVSDAENPCTGGADYTGRGARLLDSVLLLALGAPAVAVAAWVADCEWPQVAASQCYLVAAAFLVAACLRADAQGSFLGWYWLGLGALGGGGPFVAFVAEDLLQVRLAWLYAASPFRVADRLCQPWEFAWSWAVPFVALILLAAALAALPLRRRAS
ncbi:MAG: hypothetical protein FJ291_21670 [Planctomycetes bacterium]|nr:hypothetical protein [Planctomycetota bacterium]